MREEGFGPGESEICGRVAKLGLINAGDQVLMRHLMRAGGECVGVAETCWDHVVHNWV